MLNFVRSRLPSWLGKLSGAHSKYAGYGLLAIYTGALLGIIAAADFGIGSHPWSAGLSVWVESIPAGDKLGHFILFGILAFLVNVVVAQSGGSMGKHLKITVWITFAVILEEFSQIFLPNRNFDSLDLVADLSGILVFSTFAYFWMRSKLAT